MNGLTVTELHTQDGWDWPSGCTDERWPVGKQQDGWCVTCTNLGFIKPAGSSEFTDCPDCVSPPACGICSPRAATE